MIRAALVVGIVVSTFAGTEAVAPATLPNTPLRLIDGTLVRATDYKGSVLVVDFWASWCVPCRASFPALDALYQSERARGLEVLAINVDEDRRQADAFLAEHPHVMPVALDPKGEAPRAFNVKGMPSSFVVDRKGVIRFTHIGYSTKILDRYQAEISQLLAEAP